MNLKTKMIAALALVALAGCKSNWIEQGNLPLPLPLGEVTRTAAGQMRFTPASTALVVSPGPVRFSAIFCCAANWTLQGSTNLETWYDVTNFQSAPGTNVFSATPPAVPVQFFRLVTDDNF